MIIFLSSVDLCIQTAQLKSLWQETKTAKLLNNSRILVWGSQGFIILYANIITSFKPFFVCGFFVGFFWLPVTVKGDN